MFSMSPYKLNMYLKCPRQYWWSYINPSTRRLQIIRPYFTMGDHVHNSLKNFFNLAIQERTKTKLLELLADQWQKRTGLAGGFISPRQEAEYKNRAQLMLSGFCETEDIKIQPLWASDSLIKVSVSQNLDFIGKLDRVDETPAGLHIIDYKTSKEEREDEWQLPMYAVMAKRFFKKPVAKLSYLFLEKDLWLSMPANPAREAMTIGRIEQIVANMPHNQRPEAWVCSEAEFCTHCNYLEEFGIDPHSASQGAEIEHGLNQSQPMSNQA